MYSGFTPCVSSPQVGREKKKKKNRKRKAKVTLSEHYKHKTLKARTVKPECSFNYFMEMVNNPSDPLLLIGNVEYEVRPLLSDAKNIRRFCGGHITG